MAKNANASQADEFESIIENTLKEVVKTGINKEALLAGINSSEFKFRANSARDMLAELDILYNRARQAAITQEITEVIAGATSGNQPAGRGYTDRSILVDAALHTKGESNLEYLQISQELDDLLRPVFRFTDKGEASCPRQNKAS